MSNCNAFLVETIPMGMASIEGIKDVKYTRDVLTDLTNKARESIDLTAMYWTLGGIQNARMRKDSKRNNSAKWEWITAKSYFMHLKTQQSVGLKFVSFNPRHPKRMKTTKNPRS